MKKICLIIVLIQSGIKAQVINTAVPFLEVPTSSAGIAMGNTGVATGMEDNTGFYNPAKLTNQKSVDHFSATYIPWMRSFSKDMKIVNASYSYRMDENQVVGGGLTYFNMGHLLLKDENGAELGSIKSNELAINATYARALTYDYSIGVTLRGIYSRVLNTEGYSVPTVKGAYGISADIGLLRTIELDYYKNIRLGINISNLGNKISYGTGRDKKTSIPTSLKLGVSYDNEVNDDNSFTIGLDINKLLVPSQPWYDTVGKIVKGKDPNRSYLSGVATSLFDAPGGFKEELREFNICLGTEYRYKDILALRAGISYESSLKGNRSYIGTGLEYKGRIYDQKYSMSIFYLIPFINRNFSPLTNTFGFGVTLDLGVE
jgi:hypothetical protein